MARGRGPLRRRFQDAAASGQQVGHDQRPLVQPVEPFDVAAEVVRARVKVDHRQLRAERVRRGDVQPPERHACDEVERRHLGVELALERLDLTVDDVGDAPERLRMADEQSQVDVHRRVDRGAPEGEAAELDGA